MRPAWSCRLATAGDRAATSVSQRGAASNLHQPVRQLVGIERARREVLGQHRAALLDRGDGFVAAISALIAASHTCGVTLALMPASATISA